MKKNIIFYYFPTKKFCFKKNKHKDVIFLDDGYANISLDKISSSILNFNEVNIYYLIITLFQKISLNQKNMSFKELYHKNLFNSYTPKVAIGHDLTGRAFYCKKICPNIVSMTYQLGIISRYEIEEFKKKYEDSKCDYYYVYDKMHKDIFSEFVKSKFIVSGSIKNNEIKLSNGKKNYNISYISVFKRINKQEKKFLEHQSYILKILDQFCEKKKINFHIALNSKRPDKKFKINFDEEIKFIKQFAKNFIIENLSSYELANRSKIIVSPGSNLGYELFARKKRVLFAHLSEKAYRIADDRVNQEYEDHDDQDGGLYISKKDSDFMITKFDEDLLLQKLEKIMTMSDIEWAKIVENSSLKMSFDEGNTLLKNNIKKYISTGL